MHMRMLIIGCIFFLFSVAYVGAEDLKELEIDHALTLNFSTPHTKWAKPYTGGKIRVLFFTDGTSLNPRECVELMQRFDIDGQAVFWGWSDVDSPNGHWQWHGGEAGERRMLALLRQQWDCFVILGRPPVALPARQKHLLMEAVQKGAGLVLVKSLDETLLPGSQRVKSLPAFLEHGEAYTVGAGRGLYLPKQSDLGYYDGWEVDYDHWQEKFGRAVLWAADREPKVHLRLSAAGSSADGRKITVSVGRKTVVSVKVTGKTSDGSLKIAAVLRRPGHESVPLPDTELAADGCASLTIPRLSQGTWYLDARIMGSAGVETWGTLMVEVRSERSIAEVKLYRNWGESGGAITGEVALLGTGLPEESLRVRLLDRRGRELLRHDFSALDRPVEFSFPVADWLPMLVTVEAQLFAGGSEVANSRKWFHVTKRKHERFNFLIWGVPKGTLAPFAEESLARQGVTLQLDWENPPPYVGAFDISWVPFTTHLKVEKTPDGVMKPFCWNDKRAVDKQVNMLASIHRRSREHGTFVYSIGDENKTRGSCLSPSCAEEYRVFLQRSYGSLEALNLSWETRFDRWSDVGLSDKGDDNEEHSRMAGNYPRWFDRQAYKSWNYVQYCLKYAKAYSAIDPQAKTGFDGAATFASGDDIDLIIRSMGSWVPYQTIAEEVIRSVAPRSFVRSNWVGGRDKTAGPLLYKYWRLVSLGADSIWWWMWSCIGNLHGFLAPDLRPFPEIAEVVKDTQVVRDGLGDLLLQATMQHDGVAVLYSYPSVFADQLEAGPSFGKYEEAHSALIRLIRNAGFQFQYVTDRMLRQGEADLSRYKVLFLPRTEAIGDTEAVVIRHFVENGGTVVADVRPGLYDDHCKPRRDGVLDGVFGIGRKGTKAARIIRIGGGKNLVTDGDVVAKGARVGRMVDGVPLWLTHSFGKGRAILLNTRIDLLPEVLPAKEAVTLWGGTPPIRVVDSGGNRPKDLEVTRWHTGRMEIVSLLRKGGKEEKVTVNFPGTRYGSDLRSRTSAGPANAMVTTILPDRATFLVLAEKPLPAPRLVVDDPRIDRGTVLKAQLAVPGADGLHALKLTVQAGNRRLDWHDRTLVVGAIPVTVEFPIAYNDPAGEYSITVSDLYSAQQQVTTFSVDSEDSTPKSE